jgi:hypothetical protein
MMKFILYVLPFFCLLSCKVGKEVVTENGCPNIAEIGDENQSSDPFQIIEVEVRRNMVLAIVEYSGGCGKHDFKLVGSANLSKSLPPIRQVSLIHHANGDQCKMLVKDTICFDAKPLAYQSLPGSVVKLNIKGWEQELVYTFEKD